VHADDARRRHHDLGLLDAQEGRGLTRGLACVAFAAQPALQTTARIVVPLVAMCCSDTISGAALISFVVTTDAQPCGSSKTMSARSGLRFLMPA
jgi:hypothetical protein